MISCIGREIMLFMFMYEKIKITDSVPPSAGRGGTFFGVDKVEA